MDKKQNILVCLNLTFHQLIHAGNPRPVDGINGPDALGKIYIVWQGAGEVCEQSIERPVSVVGNCVHNPLEVPVSIAVEPNLLGFLLGAQRL